MDYKVHPELKTLSANIKKFDLDNYLFKRDFEIELEEFKLDEFWDLANEERIKNSRIHFPDHYKYTEIFIVGLNLILLQYYKNKMSFEDASKFFTLFFKTCFIFYINNVKTKKDYSKILAILENNDFIDKKELHEIKILILEKESKIEFEIIKSSDINLDTKIDKNRFDDKKYQIFISSTYIDLKEERQAAVEAILKKGHIPAGMELFTAGDKSQWEVIKKWIDDSDIYLLILGGRYGSIDRKTGLSYTEMEYNYAIEKKKPLFALVLDDNIIFNKALEITRDYDLKVQKYIDFKNVILSNMSSFPKNIDQIKIEINHSLDTLISENKGKMKGWIKGN